MKLVLAKVNLRKTEVSKVNRW